MSPIKFEGVNIDLAKPEGMMDEQCFSLPAEKGVDNEGLDYILTAWMPNYEDLESLKQGKPLFVKVIGKNHPPIAMYTVDDNGEGNF